MLARLYGGEDTAEVSRKHVQRKKRVNCNSCLPVPSFFSNPVLAFFLACILSPRGWRDEDNRDSLARARFEWNGDDDDDPGGGNSFNALSASLNARVGTLPHPTLEHAAVRRKRQLGAGGFAVVFEALIPPPQRSAGGGGGQPITCACKVFSFVAGTGERQTNFFKNWLHELKVLEYLSTRPECGVVEFYGFSTLYQPDDAKMIVQICMELMRGGSLRDNLLVLKRKGQRLPLRIALRIMVQVASALKGMHAAVHDVYGTRRRVSIVHRDMKPENVLLSAKLTGGDSDDAVVCKLCDVGLAALRTDHSRNTMRHETTKVGKAGTYPYIAPETLLQGKCEPASDVFALGLLMWELVAGETPFAEVHNLDGMLPLFWQNGRRPSLDGVAFQSAPRGMSALIVRCWQADKRRRPSADQVLSALEALAPEILSPKPPDPSAGKSTGGGGGSGGGGGGLWGWLGGSRGGA